jgi:integrase/recombinase XerD
MKWQAKEIVHKGQNRIAIYFEKDAQAIKRIKLLPGARWSSTLKAWHLPDVANYRKQFGIADTPTGKHALTKIHPANQGEFQKYLEALQLKAYSKSIIKT